MSYGIYGLIIGTFLEAIISPIIPELFLIPMVLARPDEYILIGALTTLSSTAGGVGGYYLGYFGGRPIFERLLKGNTTIRPWRSLKNMMCGRCL